MSIPMGHLLFGPDFYRLFYFLVSRYVNPYGALIWTWLLSTISSRGREGEGRDGEGRKAVNGQGSSSRTSSVARDSKFR